MALYASFHHCFPRHNIDRGEISGMPDLQGLPDRCSKGEVSNY